jgi:hypothetical protein
MAVMAMALESGGIENRSVSIESEEKAAEENISVKRRRNNENSIGSGIAASAEKIWRQRENRENGEKRRQWHQRWQRGHP